VGEGTGRADSLDLPGRFRLGFATMFQPAYAAEPAPECPVQKAGHVAPGASSGLFLVPSEILFLARDTGEAEPDGGLGHDFDILPARKIAILTHEMKAISMSRGGAGTASRRTRLTFGANANLRAN